MKSTILPGMDPAALHFPPSAHGDNDCAVYSDTPAIKDFQSQSKASVTQADVDARRQLADAVHVVAINGREKLYRATVLVVNRVPTLYVPNVVGAFVGWRYISSK